MKMNISGVYDTRAEAEKAIAALLQQGYHAEDISVLSGTQAVDRPDGDGGTKTASGIAEEKVSEYQTYLDEGKILVLVDEEQASKRPDIYDGYRDNHAIEGERYNEVEPRDLGARAQIGGNGFEADPYPHK